tara:strand:+ start:309 stop:545 length:237 start_codon:yes stop_codon:yes gene_type:complete
MGLDKSRLNSKEKAVEAGLFMAQSLKNKQQKDQTASSSRFALPAQQTHDRFGLKRGILEKDRNDRGLGGHSSKQQRVF